MVSAAALVRSADGIIIEARLALGGVADRPIRLGAVEASLTGAGYGDIAARIGPVAGISPVDDTSASAAHRAHLARVLAVRTLQQAHQRSEQDQDGQDHGRQDHGGQDRGRQDHGGQDHGGVTG